jgi:hypothetical protein
MVLFAFNPGLLDLFATWSSHRALAALFSVGRAKEVLPLVFGLLSAATVSPAVVSRVHDIAEELLRLKDEEEVRGGKSPVFCFVQ